MISTERASFAGRWARAVAAAGDREFLAYEDSAGRLSRFSYASFDRIVEEVAGGLSERGVRQGSAVHLCLANSPAFVATWLAASRLGAFIVPSDPRSAAREIAVHLARTAPAVGVFSPANATAYRGTLDLPECPGASPLLVEVAEDDHELSDLRGAAVPRGSLPAPATRAAVMFTSGTTSAPKGVVVTQANYAFAGDVMAAAAAVRSDDRLLVVLPLFHADAQYYSFAAAISAGASVSLMHAFSASGFLEQAARHGATHASLFAAPMRMILARGAAPVAGVALRHVWYAQNVTADQYATLSELFGCRPRQLYGMTETIPAVLTNPALGPVPESIGSVTLGCSVDLVDPETGGGVEDGEVGEIAVTGVRGVSLFEGYLDDEETTQRSFRGGVFATGDLARRDAAGRFYFAGRRSDVLKVSGENVSTVEVEEIIAAHPGVLEVAVVGEADPVRDEVPIAYVVAAPGGGTLDVAELERFCAERLSPAKRPRRLEVVGELPRTSVGKIRKFLLSAPTQSNAQPNAHEDADDDAHEDARGIAGQANTHAEVTQ